MSLAGLLRCAAYSPQAVGRREKEGVGCGKWVDCVLFKKLLE